MIKEKKGLYKSNFNFWNNSVLAFVGVVMAIHANIAIQPILLAMMSNHPLLSIILNRLPRRLVVYAPRTPNMLM